MLLFITLSIFNFLSLFAFQKLFLMRKNFSRIFLFAYGRSSISRFSLFFTHRLLQIYFGVPTSIHIYELCSL